MSKILNFLMILLIIFFVWSIFNYYSSKKNIDRKNFNRSNIDEILREKITNLPVLTNDTDNAIEFNNSLESDVKNNKKEVLGITKKLMKRALIMFKGTKFQEWKRFFCQKRNLGASFYLKRNLQSLKQIKKLTSNIRSLTR